MVFKTAVIWTCKNFNVVYKQKFLENNNCRVQYNMSNEINEENLTKEEFQSLFIMCLLSSILIFSFFLGLLISFPKRNRPIS